MAFQPLRKAAPQDIPMAPPSREPLLPDPHDLPGVPAQPSTVASNAVIGVVAPHHRRQTGMLLGDRLVSVGPTPFGHHRHGTGVSVFGRYLPHHVLAVPRRAPDVGEAEEIERGAIRSRMVRSV